MIRMKYLRNVGWNQRQIGRWGCWSRWKRM